MCPIPFLEGHAATGHVALGGRDCGLGLTTAAEKLSISRQTYVPVIH